MARTDPRPWRATAHRPNPYGGRKRELVGRTSARTAAGLDPFIERHGTAGNAVSVWRLTRLEEADDE